MATEIVLDGPLCWDELAEVASGARLILSENATNRIRRGRLIVDALVERGIRGYGINTGVDALCDVIIDRKDQQALSRNIIMSHASGVGEPLSVEETRAIIAAQVNNYALGASGARLQLVEMLCALLNQGCTPLVPAHGSVGYLTHTAPIGLLLIGCGHALYQGERLRGGEALERIGLKPLVLEAKEGLSLVNGTPCATGLACLALSKMDRLFGWADAAAAMSYENLGSQANVFADGPLSLRHSRGLQTVGRTMRYYLEGSPLLRQSSGSRTQDPLSLRAVPHVHGAARDAFDHVAEVVNRELASVTDNPAIAGSPEKPEVHSQAHAVGAALALAMDNLAVAASQIAAISERRLDRLVNPLVSKLPPFLAAESGVYSGYMIAHYAASSLIAENRRLAAPASLDGGITSALQEDILTHATPAALKVLAILNNVGGVIAIEIGSRPGT